LNRFFTLLVMKGRYVAIANAGGWRWRLHLGNTGHNGKSQPALSEEEPWLT
jgi:hypothetical protein